MGRWPGGLALLFAIGLAGSIALLFIAQAAAQVGFEDTLEAELTSEPLIVQLLLVALLAPVIEETAFRLVLASRLRLGAAGAAGAIGAAYFAFGPPLVQVVAALFGVVMVAACVLWGQAMIAGTMSEPGVERAGMARTTWHASVERWWTSHARWPVWCSIALFSYVHLSNYDVSWSLGAVIAAPFVVSPQLWLGLIFTIARVRYGWWAGLVLHACHNLTVWSVFSVVSSPAVS